MTVSVLPRDQEEAGYQQACLWSCTQLIKDGVQTGKGHGGSGAQTVRHRLSPLFRMNEHHNPDWADGDWT